MTDSSPSPTREAVLSRFRDDFEFWAATCVRIIDKETKQSVPFILNRPQRRLLALIEEQRRLNLPIRVIMLKARQWGGSTFVQVYFAWLQIIHLRNWHSLICAHVKDSAANIRGMYSHLLANYPEDYWEEEGKPEFRPFERMSNIRVIPGRGCRVTICSSENQDSVRGMDCSMAHLSEVAFWKDSRLHKPEDLIRSVLAGISLTPLSMVVMESTANGVGNFFHREWLRAVEGGSDKIPFFVPWHEMERYRTPVDDPVAFEASLSDYERWLIDACHCSLEAVNWYRNKSREYPDVRSMMAEYPSTPDEAFSATDLSVFDPAAVKALREHGCTVQARRGEVEGLSGSLPSEVSAPRFHESPTGKLLVWREPATGHDYVAALDIGGRSPGADYSVLSVIDVHSENGHDGSRPEVVAQWRGHLDHDLLAWRAAAVATWYNTALLVIESNTWESQSEGTGQYILSTLAENYPNLYRRRPAEGSTRWLPGFHTNVRTKSQLISHLISLVRDCGYIERDHQACNELLQYEIKDDGSYGARDGCHDDILMSRAIALWNIASERSHPAASIPLTAHDLAALLR